jgi:hypothetical protein
MLVLEELLGFVSTATTTANEERNKGAVVVSNGQQ